MQNLGAGVSYLAVQFFHSDKVQRLEGMSRRCNEVKADVDPGVMIVEERAFDLQFFLEIVFKLSVNVVNNGLVAMKASRKEKSIQRQNIGMSL